MKNVLVLALVFTIGFTVLISSADNAYAQAIRNNAGFTTSTLGPTDDGFSAAVPMGFVVDFFNVVTGDLFVNNNGNITFDSPLASFTPFDLTSTGRQIIAPFFADVDTSLSGSPVTYGQDMVNGRSAFGVNWINVDCWITPASNPSGLNDFQLVIIERFDTGAGNFDFEFNYDSIMWESGMLNNGFDPSCLGGTSARVGYSDGSADPRTFFELAGSAVPGAFLDSNLNTGLIHNSFPQNSQPLGRYLFEVRDGQVSIPTPPVAGVLLSIDASALLLSGFMMNALWLLPTLAATGIAGTGFYLIRSRWNKTSEE